MLRWDAAQGIDGAFVFSLLMKTLGLKQKLGTFKWSKYGLYFPLKKAYDIANATLQGRTQAEIMRTYLTKPTLLRVPDRRSSVSFMYDPPPSDFSTHRVCLHASVANGRRWFQRVGRLPSGRYRAVNELLARSQRRALLRCALSGRLDGCPSRSAQGWTAA